jgi:hypothetical protein
VEVDIIIYINIIPELLLVLRTVNLVLSFVLKVYLVYFYIGGLPS